MGLTLTDEMLKKADELEEQLIKTEVLPTLSKDIEPRLSQIQRELVVISNFESSYFSKVKSTDFGKVKSTH